MKTPAKSGIDRRKDQNREAQRRFRAKQAKQAQQSKEEFERLTSKYEALLAENESLKNQQPAQGNHPKQASDELVKGVLDPIDLDWELILDQPGQAVDFADGFESELLLTETQDVRACTPQDDHNNKDSDLVLSTSCADLRHDELHHIPISDQRPVTGADKSPLAGTGVLPYQEAENMCLEVADPLDFANLQSNSDNGSCNSWPFPPPLPGFGLGLADSFAGPFPRVDLVQAVVQVALAQERMALIDLERAKLRVCQC